MVWYSEIEFFQSTIARRKNDRPLNKDKVKQGQGQSRCQQFSFFFIYIYVEKVPTSFRGFSFFSLYVEKVF